jgi:hypothetical protein
MRGTAAPLRTPKTEGGFWQPPDVSFGLESAPKKCSVFLATFLKRKHMFGAQIGHFFCYVWPKRGGRGSKVCCFAYIWGKGLNIYVNNYNKFILLYTLFIFICLGPQTKQIMVAKFQTQMLLIANAESSSFEAVTSLYMYSNAEKFRGDHCVMIVKRQAH